MKEASSLWKPPLGWLTLGLALTVVGTAFEALAVATILPVTSAELGGIAWYGWTFSAFMLANLVGIVLGGSETDRRGPTRPFLIGTALFAGGLVLSGLAPSMPVIVAGRTAQGLGAGLLSAVSYACIARAYSVALQPRMLATLSSAWVIPGLVGPGLAGLVAEHASWRWVFLGLAPLQGLAALLVVPALNALPRLPEQPQDLSRARDALLLAVGASAALAGLSLHGWLAAVVVSLAGSTLALFAFRRLMPPGTLQARPGLPAALVCMALLNAAFFGTEAFVPLAMREVRGQPTILTGTALTAAAITWTAGAWLPLRLAARIGRRAVIRLGLLIMLVGIGCTLALLARSVPAPLLIVAWGITGLGMGLAFTTTSAAILEAAPRGQEGATSAALQLMQVLGAALATGIGGALLTAPFARDSQALAIAAVDVLMLGVVMLTLLAAGRVSNAATSGDT